MCIVQSLRGVNALHYQIFARSAAIDNTGKGCFLNNNYNIKASQTNVILASTLTGKLEELNQVSKKIIHLIFVAELGWTLKSLKGCFPQIGCGKNREKLRTLVYAPVI